MILVTWQGLEWAGGSTVGLTTQFLCFSFGSRMEQLSSLIVEPIFVPGKKLPVKISFDLVKLKKMLNRFVSP